MVINIINIPTEYGGQVFVTSEQQDAQEFLGFVTDGVNKDLKYIYDYIHVAIL